MEEIRKSAVVQTGNTFRSSRPPFFFSVSPSSIFKLVFMFTRVRISGQKLLNCVAARSNWAGKRFCAIDIYCSIRYSFLSVSFGRFFPKESEN